jgi:hypothetical protein
MYYASLLWQWHPVMILVATNHPFLRVGRHKEATKKEAAKKQAAEEEAIRKQGQ